MELEILDTYLSARFVPYVAVTAINIAVTSASKLHHSTFDHSCTLTPGVVVGKKVSDFQP